MDYVAVFSFAIQKSACTSNPSGRPGMNTAINAYTSNYESCYSRDAATVRGGGGGAGERRREPREIRRRKREIEIESSRRDLPERLILQISVVCALIGLSKPARLSEIMKLREVLKRDARSCIRIRVDCSTRE